MSNVINGTNPSPNTASAASGIQAITQAVNKSLGKNDFLKLLTTELKNQDPLQPMDNKDFIAQMAQFSSLEQMNNVSKSMDELRNSMNNVFQQSSLTQGAAMIGKWVSGMDTDGKTIIEGLVDAVKVSGGNSQLQIRKANGDIVNLEMNQVKLVKDPQPAGTGTTSITTP